MSDHRDQAVVLLVNYFQGIAKRAGMKWDPDYTMEIGDAVDHIIEDGKQRYRELDERLVEVVRRLDKHEQQLKGRDRWHA